MKRTILLFASMIATGFAMAQSPASFGLRGGLSSASMHGEAVDNLNNLLDFTNGAVTTESRTGFYGGAYASLALGRNVSVEPGLYYAQKGYEMRGDLNVKGIEFLGANAKARLTTHYIDLPLLLKLQAGGFEVFAGPQVSYLASADLKASAGVLGLNLLNRTLDATEQFNRWDAGLAGGLGYQFANGVNLRASYEHGLARTDAGQHLNAYNRSIKVGLGFRF